MKRYISISIALITVIYGCAFRDRPWKTDWQESHQLYDLHEVQTSAIDKPIWHDNSKATTDKQEPAANSKQSSIVNPQSPSINQQHATFNPQPATRYPIDLPTVLRLAGTNHLDIALFREKAHEAYANAIVAIEGFIPTLNPGLRFERREGETQKNEGNFIDVDAQQTFIGSNLTLDLELGDAIYSTLAEMQRYQASQSALKAKTHDAILEAAIAYIELARAQAQVVIAGQAVEITEKLVNQTETAVLQGMGFKGDVLRARSQLSSNKLALTGAKEAFNIASVRLAAILRLDHGIELYPAEKVLVPIKLISDSEKLPELIKKAMIQRPELKEAEANLVALKNERDGTVWGPLIPLFRAEGGAGGLGHDPDTFNSRVDYKVSLGWKIGPGGLFDMGRQHQTSSRYEAKRIGLAKLVQEIEEDIRIAYAKVIAKTEQMKIAEDGLTDAAESLKLNQERQMMGIGIPLEVLQAEEALTKARLDHLVAITEYNKSQLTLFTKIGINPVDGMDRFTNN